MIRLALKAAIGTLAATFLVGCQGDPRYGQYTRSRPDPEEIAGLWSLDVAASDWQPADSDVPSPHTLEFGLDGSVTARNIPDAWDYDNRRVQGGYDSGEGTWSFRKNQDFWVFNLRFPEINREGPAQNFMLHLVGQSPPYRILAVIGDPDEGRALVFRKEQPAK